MEDHPGPEEEDVEYRNTPDVDAANHLVPSLVLETLIQDLFWGVPGTAVQVTRSVEVKIPASFHPRYRLPGRTITPDNMLAETNPLKTTFHVLEVKDKTSPVFVVPIATAAFAEQEIETHEFVEEETFPLPEC